MESFLGKTVILADGDFPAGDEAVAALRGAARVVCCDRAAVAYAARFGRPDAAVF